MSDNLNRQTDSQGRIRPMSSQGASSDFQGRIPPQALDMEEAVLGALLLEKDALPRIIDTLRPEMFYKAGHQAIFESMLALFQQSEPVDVLTVKDHMRKSGSLDTSGGAFYLAELTSKVASAANIEHHARVIAEKFLLRELIKLSDNAIKQAYDPTSDALDLLDETEQGIFKISENQLRRNYERMDSLVMKTLDHLEEVRSQDSSVTGIPSGFTALDAMTAGWQRTDMVIIAARPAMGKCLGKGTKVFTFDGRLIPVEDVRVGDLLMGPDSKPRRVKSIATGQEEMFWIRQNQGIDYRVNASHLLSLKKEEESSVLNIAVRDFIKKPAGFQKKYKGYKVAVEFPEKALPVDPYQVGLTLAQEKLAPAHSHELVQTKVFPAVAKRHAFSLQSENGPHSLSEYIANSRKNRLELLAGLIDASGNFSLKHNGYEITQKREGLARQIKLLCDSLGFKTSIRRKRASISSIGFESEVWRVRFSGNIEEIPVRIPRKVGKPYTTNRDWRVTGLQVESDGMGEYYGFELEGPDGLFLLEDMTVTHNTALTLTLARNAAVRFNTGVALFSLEMAGIQLTQRLLTSEAELDAQKVRTGRLEDYEWKQLITRVGNLSKADIFIDDTPGLSISDLRAKARRLKAERNIGMIIIDYLQLMTGNQSKGGNREQEIAGISRSLKIIAKELDVCVIALSQLSRAVESRGGDKRPVLSDLRESGSIEQDADMVAFLYRPEYYGFETDDEGNSTQGLAELIIAKQRNGPTGTVKLQFIGKYGKFTDWGYQAGGNMMGGAPSGPGTITLPSRMNQPPPGGDTPPPPPTTGDDEVPF